LTERNWCAMSTRSLIPPLLRNVLIPCGLLDGNLLTKQKDTSTMKNLDVRLSASSIMYGSLVMCKGWELNELVKHQVCSPCYENFTMVIPKEFL